MSTATEHETVQARILAYAVAIRLRDSYGGQVGCTFVSLKEAEQRRGFDRETRETPIKGRAKGRTLFFEDLLDANPSSPTGYAGAKVREFKPRYAEAEGALPGKFPPSRMGYGGTSRHLHTDIYGNPPSPMSYGGTSREFVEHLRNRGKFFDHEEKREASIRTSLPDADGLFDVDQNEAQHEPQSVRSRFEAGVRMPLECDGVRGDYR